MSREGFAECHSWATLPGPCWAASVEAVNSKVHSSWCASIRKKPFTGQAEVNGSNSAVHLHLLRRSRRARLAQVSATTASLASTERWWVPPEVLATNCITELHAGRRTIHTVAKISNKGRTKPATFRLAFQSSQKGFYIDVMHKTLS